jgi:hypothetical protein
MEQRQQQEKVGKEGEKEKQSMLVASLEGEGRTEEPHRAFLFAMNSPVTRERYSTRLRGFFNFFLIASNKVVMLFHYVNC